MQLLVVVGGEEMGPMEVVGEGMREIRVELLHQQLHQQHQLFPSNRGRCDVGTAGRQLLLLFLQHRGTFADNLPNAGVIFLVAPSTDRLCNCNRTSAPQSSWLVWEVAH
jgi:hypothetical protein